MLNNAELAPAEDSGSRDTIPTRGHECRVADDNPEAQEGGVAASRPKQGNPEGNDQVCSLWWRVDGRDRNAAAWRDRNAAAWLRVCHMLPCLYDIAELASFPAIEFCPVGRGNSGSVYVLCGGIYRTWL